VTDRPAELDPTLVSDALVVWTGKGSFAWPHRGAAGELRLADRFGRDRAAELVKRIHELTSEFYASDARHTVAELSEMGDLAAREFRRRHPELSDEAVDALAWCYTFDYK
jgi:hypothetical protein